MFRIANPAAETLGGGETGFGEERRRYEETGLLGGLT
jgi:hypothetical protein